MRRVLIYIFLAGSSAACSSIPDVEYSYYPYKSSTNISITQVIYCDNDKTSLLIATTPAIVTSYAADYSKGPYNVRIKRIEGPFSSFVDSTATFTFTEDGRLKTINQETLGQGEAAIKSAFTLGSTLTKFGLFSAKTNSGNVGAVCDAIAKLSADGKGTSATVSYAWNGDLDDSRSTPIALNLTPAASATFSKINVGGVVPKPTANVAFKLNSGSRVKYHASCGYSESDVLQIRLQQTETADVAINDGVNPTWHGSAIVPVKKSLYCLPIPQAALFGSQKFGLQLSDAGAITSVTYGKGSGAAASLNAANAAATALAPQTDAMKAADIKAEADVIAQQQRLVRCRTNPSACT